MKDIFTKNVGTGKIELMEPIVLMRPTELYLKEDGAKDDTASFVVVLSIPMVAYAPKVAGEVSLKMLNEAMNELGYKIIPA